MSKLATLLVVGAVLGTAGLAMAQVPALFPKQPHDVSYEYYADDEGSSNGLPLAAGATDLILDSKAFVGTPGVAALGMSRGLPLNEWIVPAIPGNSDPENPGQRTKSYIAPGLTRFHAWFGNWTDKDGDQSIDALNDTNTDDEWTGYNTASPNGNHTIKVWIHPGHHPGFTSDYWVLGDFVFDSGFLANNESDYGSEIDFEMAEAGDGNWTGSALILMMENSLLESLTVHTVADGFKRSIEPFYSCAAPGGGTAPTCRVDKDRYDAVDPIVESLWSDALDVINTPIPIPEPVADLLGDVIGIANSVNVLSSSGTESETAQNDPYASMTTAYGAPRQAGGYNYVDDYHAFGNVLPFAAITEPNSIYGAISPPNAGKPGVGQDAEGFGPVLFFVGAAIGVGKDINGDGNITGGDGSAELDAVSCLDIVDTTTGRPANLTGLLYPVADDGVSPVPWGPTGIYQFYEDPDRHVVAGGIEVDDLVVWYDEMVFDLTDLDLVLDRHVKDGPVPFKLSCDAEDPSEWGSAPWTNGYYYLMPAGTYGFNIRMVMDDNIGVRHTLASGTTVTEKVKDIDLWRDWSI